METINIPSKSRVDRAGDYYRTKVVNGLDQEHYKVVKAWRDAYITPVNYFNNKLNSKIKELGLEVKSSQRLKRFVTIVDKLEREKKIRLSQMQDIGGLRLIFKNQDDLYLYYNSFKNSMNIHSLHHEVDYIHSPKESGYRGVHLTYKFKSHGSKLKKFNGLVVEIQLRTELQHLWATLVESFDVMQNKQYKFSKGSREMLKYLNDLSFITELYEKRDTSKVQFDQLNMFLKFISDTLSLGIIEKISSFAIFARVLKEGKKEGLRSYYTIIHFDYMNEKVLTYDYPKEDFSLASNHYSQIERDIENETGNDTLSQAVFVHATEDLELHYPSYYLIKKHFRKYIDDLLDFVQNETKRIHAEAEIMYGDRD